MGFLTILNYIAMGVGYFVLLIVLLFFLWLLISTIKDKMQTKKWERERAEKEKIAEMVKEKEEATAQQDQTTAQQNTPETNQNAPQTTQSTTTIQTEKKESENKEDLVDENGNVRMVN